METRTIVFLFLIFKLLIKYNMYDQQEWLHNKNSHWCHSNFPNMHAKLRLNNLPWTQQPWKQKNMKNWRRKWKFYSHAAQLDVKHIDVKNID